MKLKKQVGSGLQSCKHGAICRAIFQVLQICRCAKMSLAKCNSASPDDSPGLTRIPPRPSCLSLALLGEDVRIELLP